MSYTYTGKPIGLPFIELPAVDSTNNYALTQIRAGMAEHGAAIFTHHQVAGKGQRGKSWTSEENQNIALSIILQPAPMAVSDQFGLSACAALSARELVAKYAGDNVKIKWPNDIYWKDRKAGGILIESVIKGSPGIATWDWAVIGTGINVNQVRFPDGLANPVSIRQITGKVFDPLELARELCAITDRNYRQLHESGPGSIMGSYISYLYCLGEKVKFRKAGRVFEGIVRGVSTDGRLIVYHGVEEHFSVGEIEWMIG